MPRPDVLVVAEMPSLGSAVCELLAAGGLQVACVPGFAEAVDLYSGPGTEPPRVLVSAAANRPSETARGWAGGPFAALPLVVIGSRDPGVAPRDRFHFVSLPLSPTRLLELVRRLAGRYDPTG